MHRIILVIIALVAVGLVACTTSEGQKQRETAVEGRFDNLARAKALYPDPISENFPQREALVKFSQRVDLVDHPWYIYILGDNGNVIGYYVAQHRPVNSCAFLSSTEDIQHPDSGGNVVLTAPSLDGIYYGGGGASAGCDEWFFFDAATDAMIEIRGVKFFESDQPLLLEAEPITVSPQ